MKKRMLSLLLCCCLLVGAFRPVKAHAVVVDSALLAAGGVALVGSLLVAGGAAFKSNDDLQAVAQDIYDRYIQPSSALLSEVTGLVQAWYKGVASGVVCCANISTRLWSAICGDPVAENVASGNYGTGTKSFYLASNGDIGASGDKNLYSYCSNNMPMTMAVGGHIYRLFYRASDSRYAITVDSTEPSNWFSFNSSNYPKPYFYPNYGYGSGGIYYFMPSFRSSYGISRISVAGAYVEVAYPCTVTFGQGLTYPTDKDLIRPGERSAVVQLPSDLPRYGEDGATVEMPVLGLTQEDYLITDSDVLSPDKVDEDVILDVKTGSKVTTGEDTGEVTDPTTPIAGNILEWLKSVLKGLLDAIISLLTAIRDGILSIPQAIAKAVAAIFCPTDEAIQAVQTDVATKLPLITDVKSILGNFSDLLKNPDKAASGLALTTIVDLGKHTGGGWSDAKINLLDASWFLPYKSLTDDIIVGLAWLVFLWNLYGQLPGIIHGSASDLSVTARTSREGDIRGS